MYIRVLQGKGVKIKIDIWVIENENSKIGDKFDMVVEEKQLSVKQRCLILEYYMYMIQ